MFTLRLPFSQQVWKPGIKSSILALLLVYLFVRLGLWQFNRYEQKVQWQKTIENHHKNPTFSWEEIISQYHEQTNEENQALWLKNSRFQSISVQGRFLDHMVLLLDNQTYKNQVGYQVLSLFQPTHDFGIVLVDRGFIPMGNDRNKLPNIPVLPESPSPVSTLVAIMNLPSHGINLFSSKNSKNLPPIENLTQKINSKTELGTQENKASVLRIQSIDFKELSSILGQPIYPFLLKLPKEHPKVFNHLPINFSEQAKKHLGYAIQWFIISLVTLIYYIVINTRRISYESNKTEYFNKK